MSLFENDEYRWRETYFVLMQASGRPTGEVIHCALSKENKRYELSETRVSSEGFFDSLTLYSPDDNAAMDITYIEGDEVVEQTTEMVEEMKRSASSEEERAIVKRLAKCDARLDVYHFERITFLVDEDEEEEFLDPGSLLIVLEKLAELCNGFPIDPQTGTVLS